MAASKEDIRGWFERGKAQGATHMIVVCDTYDWDDYPAFVKPDEKVHERVADYHYRNMQRVVEVYRLNLDMEAQLSEHRAYNL